ncbi:hypothetical protein DVT68_01485 [Dyella solisilvae]|uniref:Uncharacterized protein n=1 Tax=Dyella solisilvae TaxID=1920168 RepID=A0A370KA80_9GAMM|nr:hypothetical protein [Dyella solisilvae]RDI99553.1 hypothetical protein DVT68_01485 [Dyella solisilvae]
MAFFIGWSAWSPSGQFQACPLPLLEQASNAAGWHGGDIRRANLIRVGEGAPGRLAPTVVLRPVRQGCINGKGVPLGMRLLLPGKRMRRPGSHGPDTRKHQPDPVYLRPIFDRTGLTQAQAANAIGVTSCTIRSDRASGDPSRPAPHLVKYALEQLAAHATE